MPLAAELRGTREWRWKFENPFRIMRIHVAEYAVLRMLTM